MQDLARRRPHQFLEVEEHRSTQVDEPAQHLPVADAADFIKPVQHLIDVFDTIDPRLHYIDGSPVRIGMVHDVD